MDTLETFHLAARDDQVVRPRSLRASRSQRFIAEGEHPSVSLSNRGASRTCWSPTIGGGEALGPDCFLFYSSRVLSIRA